MLRHFDPGGAIYGSVGTANANVLAWWTSYSTTDSTLSVSAGNGRTTGPCLRFFVNGTNRVVSLMKTFDAQATWGAAFAVKVPSLPPGAGNSSTLLQVLDAGSIQVDLRLNSDGTLSVTRNGTILGSTATAAVSPLIWVHLELKVLIHPSAGTVTLNVNGTSKITLTSQNTRATANSTANQVVMGQCAISTAGVTGNLDFVDIVVYDGQATDANGNADITGPIGDCGVYWLLPTGAGTTTQFTPDTGSNYARVNEATPDGDTSYVESAVVGNIDTYALADLPAGVSSVKSLALVHYARKTDVGSRQLGATLRSGGANSTHATGVDLGNSYQYSARNWGCDPATAAAWTVAGVNALEVGQKVNS